MAEATFTFPHIDEIDDDPHISEQTLTLEPIPYWSHNDFDLYLSDPEFPYSDHSLHRHSHEDDLSDHVDCASFAVRGFDDFSDRDSISITDLFDRENQVNIVMDLFQQRVEQSQVARTDYLVSEPLDESSFDGIEGNSNVGIDGLDLGFDVDKERVDCDDDFVYMVEGHGRTQNFVDDDDDDFIVERMASASINGEASTMIRVVQSSENCLRDVGFGSDSDDGESDALEICVNSEDECDVHEFNDDVASITLCRDSLQLDDRIEANEDFEWEEVDGRGDERDVLSLHTEDGSRNVSVSVVPIVGTVEEEDVRMVRVGGSENLEWQVLLNDNNLDMHHAAHPYLAVESDSPNTAEYDMTFGQFAESEYPLTARPPAAKSVVQNLPPVVLSKEDVENDKAPCAICKEDFNVGEQAKRLACGHIYHGDCITPWLGIRNTCPVCRYEYPTDDAYYDRWRIRTSDAL